MPLKELTEALLRIEDELDLLNQTISGFFFWERVRFPVQRCVFHAAGLSEAPNPRTRRWLADGTRMVLSALQNTVIRNPMFSPHCELLFMGSRRRILREDGKWWDIYCDPVIESLARSYVCLEFPYLFAHLRPAKTENLRYLDFLHCSSVVQRMLLTKMISLTRGEKQLLQQVQAQIMAQCGVRVDLESMIKRDLITRRSHLLYYQHILQKIKPEIAIVICSYGKETFIEACKNSGITVVELQHGIISRNELSYSYPGPSRTKRTFPDYLLVFGDYWKESVEFPISKQQVISVGYPFLEIEVQRHDAALKKDQLLFISQGTVGKELSRFAVELSNARKLPWGIVYKLHPAEYGHWQKRYPWLASSGIEVIDNDAVPLHRLFAESKAQIGVNSAAIFEGLFFGLRTYLLNLPEVEYMEDLVGYGLATVINSVDDLFNDSLRENAFDINIEYFFRPNALENIRTVFDRLLAS